MVTPASRRNRLLFLVGIAVLAAGPLIGPELTPLWTIPVSAIWLAVAAGCSIGLLRWSRRFGWPAPALLLLAGLGVMATFGRDWSGGIGTRMPCRRNWSWLPSYLLRSSPTRSVSFDVGDVAVKVCYGSPRARGRKMLGGTQVPFGQLWRTGANEPTTIRASGPITVAGVRVDGGKASLYSVPGPETWEIILNASTTQWGIESEYAGVRGQEIGRSLVLRDSTATHQEALELTAAGAGAATVELILSWERSLVRIPIGAAPR